MDKCLRAFGLTANSGESESMCAFIAYAFYDEPTMMATDVYLIAYLIAFYSVENVDPDLTFDCIPFSRHQNPIDMSMLRTSK